LRGPATTSLPAARALSGMRKTVAIAFKRICNMTQ
jgi:hypothetical protein